MYDRCRMELPEEQVRGVIGDPQTSSFTDTNFFPLSKVSPVHIVHIK
jgi:hypothetical protein